MEIAETNLQYNVICAYILGKERAFQIMLRCAKPHTSPDTFNFLRQVQNRTLSAFAQIYDARCSFSICIPYMSAANKHTFIHYKYIFTNKKYINRTRSICEMSTLNERSGRKMGGSAQVYGVNMLRYFSYTKCSNANQHAESVL